MNDPFSLVYNGLWQMIDASAALTTMVKPGNRVKYNEATNRDPIKDRVITADMPELILVPGGISSANLHMNSCTVQIVRRYTWLVSTGDQRADKYMFPLEFEILCAMMDWDRILTALTWDGQPFVVKTELADATEGLSDAERNRGIKGWSFMWSGEVSMAFKAKALRAHLATGSSSSEST